MPPYRPASDLLKVLEEFESQSLDRRVWRHMFGDNPPLRANEKGARWNPPSVPAIYCSLDRATALAEAGYAIAVQSLRPKAKRAIYKLQVRLEKVLDLSDRSALRDLGIGATELADVDHAACQKIGGVAEWLEHDGLLVPSARGLAANLVIFTRKRGADSVIEIVETEIIT